MKVFVQIPCLNEKKNVDTLNIPPAGMGKPYTGIGVSGAQ
jgi:hypothetical protein